MSVSLSPSKVTSIMRFKMLTCLYISAMMLNMCCIIGLFFQLNVEPLGASCHACHIFVIFFTHQTVVNAYLPINGRNLSSSGPMGLVIMNYGNPKNESLVIYVC